LFDGKTSAVKLFFLAVAALIALAPGVASAHRGELHAVENTAVRAQPASEAPAALAELRTLSPSCPGGAGGKCCCENLPAYPGSTKPPVVGAAWRVIPLSAAPETRRAAVRPSARSHLSLSPSLPRAPPVFS
jgi:hypothetical protein